MNLVIGNTSQLARYFPEDYIKISSRNIDHAIFEQNWNRVYLCFAEQRTYIKRDNLFTSVNFDYTKDVIEKLRANQIVYYSTAELWNNTVGEVSLEIPYSYHNSDYIVSKEKISNHIKQNYKNVLIAYPFNFNSVYRQPPFLFGKIFDSILNKKKIEIGDTYFYRELLHPAFVVSESINQKDHKIIGNGNLVFINDFIRSLYKSFSMNYDEYVIEKIDSPSFYRKNIFYSKNRCDSDTMKLTLKEVTNAIANQVS